MIALDAVLRDAVARGLTPGVVAMAARAGGEIARAAAGVAHVGRADPMRPDSLMRIFSMTKAVGAVAAARLIEAGALDPDAPVARHLPAFAAVPVLDGWDGDAPRLRPPARPCTVRHLMTHASGLAYETWSPPMRRFREATGAPSALTGTRAALAGYPMLFDPGAGFAYGVGIDWLGLVVEAVAGRRIDAFCAAEIFAPLGMTDTVFEVDGPRADRLAGVCAETADGFRPVDRGPARLPEVYGMGHCLYSTAPDFLRLLRMLLAGGALDGARVLRPETVAMLLDTPPDAPVMGPMISQSPGSSADVDLFPGVIQRHGLLAPAVTAAVPGRRGAGALGWAGLLNTHWWLDPGRGVAGVVMMQQLPFASPRALAVLEGVERAVRAGG